VALASNFLGDLLQPLDGSHASIMSNGINPTGHLGPTHSSIIRPPSVHALENAFRSNVHQLARHTRIGNDLGVPSPAL